MALLTAQLDALTSVAGRALFLRQAETLHRDAQADAERTLAVAYIDLDGFKQVNDRLGHETGDRVLRATADVLRSCVRESDPIGRLGGDEFAVCMGAPRATVDEVGALAAARMVSAIGAIGEGIGCSVGLAAKRAGRNRLHRAD